MIIRIVKESCNPGHLGVTARGGCSLGLSLTIDTPADRLAAVSCAEQATVVVTTQ